MKQILGEHFIIFYLIVSAFYFRGFFGSLPKKVGRKNKG